MSKFLDTIKTIAQIIGAIALMIFFIVIGNKEKASKQEIKIQEAKVKEAEERKNEAAEKVDKEVEKSIENLDKTSSSKKERDKRANKFFPGIDGE